MKLLMKRGNLKRGDILKIYHKSHKNVGIEKFFVVKVLKYISKNYEKMHYIDFKLLHNKNLDDKEIQNFKEEGLSICEKHSVSGWTIYQYDNLEEYVIDIEL